MYIRYFVLEFGDMRFLPKTYTNYRGSRWEKQSIMPEMEPPKKKNYTIVPEPLGIEPNVIE